MIIRSYDHMIMSKYAKTDSRDQTKIKTKTRVEKLHVGNRLKRFLQCLKASGALFDGETAIKSLLASVVQSP